MLSTKGKLHVARFAVDGLTMTLFLLLLWVLVISR